MQAVNIQQLIPQQQSNPQNSASPQKTGDTSFMDLLHTEQSSADQNKKISQANTSEKSESENQKVNDGAQKAPEKTAEKSPSDSKNVSDNQNADSSAKKETAEKSKNAEKKSDETSAELKERLSLKKNTAPEKKSGTEKGDETAAAVLASHAAKKTASSQNADTVKDSSVQSSAQKQKTNASDEADKLAWLSVQNQKENTEDSDDDFAALIDAAIDFIPGTESEAEKLEASQNLAVNDPALFLSTITQKNAADEKNVKIAGDDKNTAGKKDKTKTTVRFEVKDERTKSADLINQKNDVKKVQAKSEIVLSADSKEGNNAQLTMDLVNHAQQNITSSSTQTAAASGSDFQSMLTNSIQQNAPEFVKAGSIVLKDNNQGSINLILHPESLGNVKINLSLSDKVIAGQITVQSQEAYNAFKESIDSIKQAFAQSGFETAGFNLNFAGNSNFAGNGQSGQQQMDSSYRADRTYGDYAASTVSSERSEAAYDNRNFYAVDIVA